MIVITTLEPQPRCHTVLQLLDLQGTASLEKGYRDQNALKIIKIHKKKWKMYWL